MFPQMTKQKLATLKITLGITIGVPDGKKIDSSELIGDGKRNQFAVMHLRAILNPHAGHLNNLGCAYAWDGKLDRAKETFQKVGARGVLPFKDAVNEAKRNLALLKSLESPQPIVFIPGGARMPAMAQKSSRLKTEKPKTQGVVRLRMPVTPRKRAR